MQRTHGPIQINQATSRLIQRSMDKRISSAGKKALVRESIVVANKVKTAEVKVVG